MKYDTKSITNILDSVEFIGRYNGVDFRFEPGKTRYLPSFVSDHICGQLITKILKGIPDKEERPSSEELRSKILGEEIKTAEEDKNLSFKEGMDRHELEFVRWQEEQRKKEILNQEKAEDILDKDSTAGGIPQKEETRTADQNA